MSLIFLFFGLIFGAGACISYNSYRHAGKTSGGTPSSPGSPPLGDRTQTETDFKRTVEEAVKPLADELEKTKETVADLSAAFKLAPDPAAAMVKNKNDSSEVKKNAESSS
jgi:hypothetical protein